MINPAVNQLQFTVNGDEDGKRLDQFLALRLGGISRMRIARLIASGLCLVTSAVKEAGMRVFAGDLVVVQGLNTGPSAMTPEPIALNVIYEDDHVIVLVKPAGMLVHPTLGVKSGTLSNALTFHLNREFYSGRVREDDRTVAAAAAASGLIRPGIVHRLDRATSGLLAVAKTQHALSVLSRHFRKGLVKKRYLAVVRGAFEDAQGSIVAPIDRDPDRRPHWWVIGTGKPAETRWRVLGSTQNLTLLELEPVTGRTNQLRIHLAYVGRPILGDALYGPSPAIESGEEPERETLLLHAWRLAFHHPETGEWCQFTAEPPHEIKSCLSAIGIPEPEPCDLPM
jgi:23S rRNA pseudouridine1911/1915/1917 synthase